jgi:thiosulfate dehydrogenase [quinone] large subunit
MMSQENAPDGAEGCGGGEPTSIARRDFVKKAVAVVAAAGACSMCGPLGQAFADEPATAPAPGHAPAGAIDAGPLASFAKDGIYDALEKPNKLLLIRTDGMLFAATSQCTHKGCALNARPDQSLSCPCHGSVFSIHGTVDQGPARRSLPRYAISLSDDKHVMVDKTQRFPEKEWDDPASFIKLS